MCDLFAMSAGQSYTAGEYLPLFAEKGRKNIHGWGIGFFREGGVHVEASPQSAFGPEGVHQSFLRLARVIDSRVIIANLNCPLGVAEGPHHPMNTPLALSFSGHRWLFVHYGVVENIGAYTTPGEPVDSPLPAARVCEFLRDGLTGRLAEAPYESLFEMLRRATGKMVERYPGHYSYFLTNGAVLFAFVNYRQLMVLRDREALGDVALITTLEEGFISREKWAPYRMEEGSRGRFLVVSGSELVHDAGLFD